MKRAIARNSADVETCATSGTMTKVYGYLAGIGAAAVVLGCGPSVPWAAASSPDYDDDAVGDLRIAETAGGATGFGHRVVSIGRMDPESPVDNPEVVQARIRLAHSDSKVVGSFRNTYYDFPTESEYGGELVSLYNSSCKPIADVKRGFHDAVCFQGSGVLGTGTVVSFAKRDCSCALECPRSGQRICFEAMDSTRFPWGRGATGKAITPLLTVAVDSDVIPLETPIYIPEFEGLPRDAERSAVHDGCFIAQDRGLKVRGEHVDVFTGDASMTRLWNSLVPSNHGVTVILDSPKCARAR